MRQAGMSVGGVEWVYEAGRGRACVVSLDWKLRKMSGVGKECAEVKIECSNVDGPGWCV